LGAVFACTRVITETQGSLPCGIYRERKSGGRDLAKDHPANELFLKPNQWQTGMEFFETMQAHLELRGNAYALKVPGNGRAINQLIPLHPDRVRVYLLPNNRLRYEVTSYSTGQIDRYSQDEILHCRGCWSYDGIMGISTVSAMAEVIGVGLAQQEHRARYFRNSAIPGMAIETVKMTDEKREEMVNSISEKFSSEGAFKVFAPPPGAKITTLGLTNKDSQLIEASQATKIEICAAWRVPPHKIADLSRGTFGNIEQQNIEFATDCIRPRSVRLERRLDSDIVNSLSAYESAPGDYYVMFDMDALFRGDMKSRFEAYQAAVSTGWMVRNEARAAEGRNAIPGLDAPLVAVNMETVDQAQKRSDANIAAKQSAVDDEDTKTEEDLDKAGGGAETPEGDEDEEDEGGATQPKKKAQIQLRALALASAGRIVRREVKGLRKMYTRALEKDLSSFTGATGVYVGREQLSAEISSFYEDLAPLIAENMHISMTFARGYTRLHLHTLLGVDAANLETVIQEIEDGGPERLALLALPRRRAKQLEEIAI